MDAKARKEGAETLIATGKPHKAERRLRRAGRRLASFEWSIRSLNGRQNIDPATMAALLAQSESLRADLAAAANAL